MKITFFVGEFNGGGAERVISILANKMIEKDFDIEILKYHNTINSYETDKRIVINSVEENTNTRTDTIKNLKWMHNHFKQRDMVISFLAPFNILALLANIGNKTPIIVADRNDPNRVPSKSYVRKIRNILYKTADKVVLQTEDNKKYFSYLKDKAVIIHNPIDMDGFIGEALKTNKSKKVVNVGRLEAQKNQIMLINAFNELKDKYSEYQLVVYGEGSYRETLQNEITKLGLNDRVYLFGETNDIFNQIKDAELFVLSSDYEGMPNALAEAMCLGLPVISTDVSGVRELIKDGENGFIVKKGNLKELVNKINYVLSNEEVRKSISQKAVEIHDVLNVDAVVEKWRNCIKQVNM